MLCYYRLFNYLETKVRLSEWKCKFWSSENKEMLAFHLLSRDKIRPKVKFICYFPNVSTFDEVKGTIKWAQYKINWLKTSHRNHRNLIQLIISVFPFLFRFFRYKHPCANHYENKHWCEQTNERTVSYPEKVDFVLILVDSKCNFVTCEFVTISTSNNRRRIVILIYNILYIYINNYYLLFVISSSFLIFLPLYRTSLMSQIHMSQSTTLKIFPDQVDSFFNCSNCSFVCLFAPINPMLCKLWHFAL